jgi:hypothetical protein
MDTKLACQKESRSVLSEAALRSAIESERARVAQLRDRIGDDPLKLLLQSAAGTLAFALIGFLDEKIMERQRTPEELAAWLGQAQRYLERATQMRKEVEAAVAERGASIPLPDESPGPDESPTPDETSRVAR